MLPAPSVSTQCCSLHSDVVSLDSSSTAWSTTFNAGTSAHMVLFSHPPASTAPPLLLNMKPVPYANEVKHLGLVITSTLQWSSHIHSLLLRVGYRVYLLKRLAYRVTSPAFVKRLYVALLRPSLEYASSVWDGACRKKGQFRSREDATFDPSVHTPSEQEKRIKPGSPGGDWLAHSGLA